MALVDLTDEELAARRPAMVAGFAADVAENFGVPLAIAAEVADRQLRTILPDGVGTGLSVPGAEPARAFADALGLPLVSQQMIKDL